MRTFLSIAGGLAVIAGLLAVQTALVYGLGWLVLVAVRRVPLIGRRHRHEAWDRLNRVSEPADRVAGKQQ